MLALVALAVITAACGAWRYYVTLPDRALVEKIVEIERDPVRRPSHVDAPVAGSFGQHFADAVDSLRQARVLLEATGDAASRHAVLEAAGPASALAPYAKARERGREGVRLALEATHAETAAPAPGMGIFADPTRPLSRDGYVLGADAGVLAAFDVIEATSSGNASAAANTCVDGFALGRDLSWGGGLLAAAVGATVQRRLAPACAVALDAAPGSLKRAALASLEKVASGMPPLSRNVAQDAVYDELAFFGDTLTPGQRARLPAPAAAVLAANHGQVPALLAWPMRVARRGAIAREARLAAAADLPEPDLERAFASVAADADTTFAKRVLYLDRRPMVRKAVSRRASLAYLVTGIAADLFRAEKGRWPATTAEIVAAGLLPGDPVDVHDGAPVAMTESNGALVIPAKPFTEPMEGSDEVVRAPALVFHADVPAAPDGKTVRESANRPGTKKK